MEVLLLVKAVGLFPPTQLLTHSQEERVFDLLVCIELVSHEILLFFTFLLAFYCLMNTKLRADVFI
ncbi:hypothetical protein SynA1840_01835 [Synechococcus sp. A18-40]|nr:hypothetical protein SynA1840_01835 [Synechococcus sp. A18-40]